jgi:transcriptional regulator with XRE-family HTH domain
MAGSSRDAGPAARLVAANLRRVRQERGLSYAELARKLAAIGHPLADTALLKTEKGDRRASVDDLVALAVVLGTTPNRLLLPPADDPGPGDPEAPWGTELPRRLWAWASGEVPLGRAPASAGYDLADRAAEAAFAREGRPHLRDVPRPAAPSRGASVARNFALDGIAGFIAGAFAAGLTTAEIRAEAEGAITAALTDPDPAAAVRWPKPDGDQAPAAESPETAEAKK